MTPQKVENNQKSSAGPKNILDRFFFYIEHFAYTHSFSVIAVSLVLAALSLWVTVEKLTFKTGRGDLVAKDLPYVQRHEKFRQEFDDFDGMIVVVEGQDPEQKKNFAEALAAKLKSHPKVFSDVFYKIDTSYFKDKALLFLDQKELADLFQKIEEHQQFLEDINSSPGLDQLLRSINSEISSGMVDTLLSDFIGTDNGEKDDTADLGLLISLLKQMTAHLKGGAPYQSPWASFFTGKEDSLKEQGYLISGKNDLMFILVTPHEDETSFTGYKDSIETARKLVDETRQQFPLVKVGITGEDVIASDEMTLTQVDVKKATLIALAGVSLLFILAFRGVVKPLMAVFSLVVALCWSIGFTTLTVGHLNILSVVFTTILIGLGIDFGIHILERYKEERIAGGDIPSSLQKTVAGTGRGNFAGAITTALAFGAMTFTDFVGVAELGWIAAWGILFCMLAMLLLLPALLAVEEKCRKTDYNGMAPSVDKKKWIDGLFRHYYIIIFVCLLLVGLSTLSLRNLAFDYNLLNLQAKNTEAVAYEIKIMENANRSTWSAAMLADTMEEAQKKLKAVKGLSTVGEVESILSLVPANQPEKLKFIKENSSVLSNLQVEEEDPPIFLKSIARSLKRIRFKLRSKEENAPTDSVGEAGVWVQRVTDELTKTDPKVAQERLSAFSKQLFADYRAKIADLRKNANPSPVEIDELPNEMRKRFISKKGRFLISIFPSVDFWDIDEREKFLTQLREVDPNVVGNAVHMFESSRLMKEGYVNGGIYAMAAIVIFVYLTFKKFKTTLFIFLPVVVGSLWTIGIMDLVGVRFNLANLVILPLILGIGVVNGIHIIHRYREEPDKSIPVLSKSTGQAVILSSLTTMIGFGSMMVADHQGIFSLGLVLTIGVGSCLVASITILPAILKLCTEKGWKV
ncbi:MAG: MMPL family transporter [Nitrospinae bacterium]|nr:MMPL family transporter [Nitrospinota bacterium]